MDPRELNLGFFNQAAAELHPDRLALIDLSRTPAREVTHIELDERMNRVGTALQKSDLEPGARILIAMPNRFEFVEAFFGAMRGGFVVFNQRLLIQIATKKFSILSRSRNAGSMSPRKIP